MLDGRGLSIPLDSTFKGILRLADSKSTPDGETRHKRSDAEERRSSPLVMVRNVARHEGML